MNWTTIVLHNTADDHDFEYTPGEFSEIFAERIRESMAEYAPNLIDYSSLPADDHDELTPEALQILQEITPRLVDLLWSSMIANPGSRDHGFNRWAPTGWTYGWIGKESN